MNFIPDERLTRIGVFYDGGFFDRVSKYYNFHHNRKSYLSIKGIHNFIVHKVSEFEKTDQNFCRIVDSHYFRGRFSAEDTEQAEKLKTERKFDEMLMQEGVITHYLLRHFGKDEKGIDVWLALEAFELAIYKRFNVSVLITGDADFVPLIRKLNTIGTRVMLLGWDLPTYEHLGKTFSTRTADLLLAEATYPVMMQTLIEDRAQKDKLIIDRLFI